MTKPGTDTDTNGGPSVNDYDVIVSITTIPEQLNGVPVSQLFLFLMYYPTRYQRVDPKDIICGATVFFGGGCWPDNPRGTHVAVVKTQKEWQDTFCSI